MFLYLQKLTFFIVLGLIHISFLNAFPLTTFFLQSTPFTNLNIPTATPPPAVTPLPQTQTPIPIFTPKYQPLSIPPDVSSPANYLDLACSAPRSQLIPNMTFLSGNYIYIDLSQYFFGTRPLVYSAINLPPGVYVNSESGLLYGSSLSTTGRNYQVTINLSTPCGTTSQTFILGIQSLSASY